MILYNVATRRPWKPADIDTDELVDLIGRLCDEKQSWLFTGEITVHYPQVPPKVVHVKLRNMEAKSIIRGCGCGCRGDWEPIDYVGGKPYP